MSLICTTNGCDYETDQRCIIYDGGGRALCPDCGAWMDALSIIVFSPHVAEQMLKDYVKAIGVKA